MAEIIAADHHLLCREEIAHDARPVARLGGVARLGIALNKRLVGLKRLARIGLIAPRVEYAVVIGHGDDVLGEVRLRGSGMEREVAIRGADRVVEFAGFVIGESRHEDGAARLLRIRMIDIDVFVLLRRVAEFALIGQRLGLLVDDVGRLVGILDNVLVAVQERAAAAEQSRDKEEAKHAQSRRPEARRSKWLLPR